MFVTGVVTLVAAFVFCGLLIWFLVDVVGANPDVVAEARLPFKVAITRVTIKMTIAIFVAAGLGYSGLMASRMSPVERAKKEE
jgi:hypothetical protein